MQEILSNLMKIILVLSSIISGQNFSALNVAQVVTSAQLVDDGLSHPPPATGTYAYNNFIPASGTSYIDPVFGSTVRRLSATGATDDIYSRNMKWNADGTRFLRSAIINGGDYYNVIDTVTGTVTHSRIPLATTSNSCDGGFDPVNPNVYYYPSGTNLRKITLQSGGTWTDVIAFTAPSTLKSLGCTINSWSADGRYIILRYGAEPSVRVYDWTNMGAGAYANPVDGSSTIDPGGFIGISPDGNYLIADGVGGP